MDSLALPPRSAASGHLRRRWVLALPLLGALPAWGAGAVQVRRSQVLMGTRVDLVAEGPQEAALVQAMDRALVEMTRLESMMSRYQRGSVVQQLADAAGKRAVAVPPDMMAVLLAGQQVYRASAGGFDPTVGALRSWNFEAGREAMPTPLQLQHELALVGAGALQLDERRGMAYLPHAGMALDLGGIAKLPILEAGMQVLEREGVAHALINGGGDVLVRGQSQGQPWRVGVRDPRTPQQLVGVLKVQGRAVVASSGDYERGFRRDGLRMHHILNPRTGMPTQGIHGVALLAQDVRSVNGWGAAIMVQGLAQARARCAQDAGVQALAGCADGTLWQSPGMQAMLQPHA